MNQTLKKKHKNTRIFDNKQIKCGKNLEHEEHPT
jgi:hypothetical protein